MTCTLVAAAIAAADAAPRRSPDPVVPLKIVALGDSLTSGHGIGTRSAYPAVLTKRLNDRGLPYTVVNAGVSGDTTTRALRRLAAALEEQPQILIVALGANDGLGGVPVAQVRRNLEQIIEAAQARGVRVLLCGMEALPIYGWQYTVEFHQIFPAIAARYHVPLVPFLLDRVIGDSSLMTSDGIHPNAEGARIIADNIWPYLLPIAQAAVTAPAAAGV